MSAECVNFYNFDTMREVREPAVAYGKQKFTIGEYLEMENAANEKHEYYQGEIFAMSGTKFTHNRISTNIIVALGTKLKVCLVSH